jgi:pentatricopeptide repeat protein
MSEMLGNQYFLSRNYQLAASVYSKVHDLEPNNFSIVKRMIICYTQIGEMDKAFDYFYELVKKDVSIITNTDPIADDCPCPELTERYGKILPYENNSMDLKLLLGILWLYCDSEKSLQFFKQLSNDNPKENRYKEIVLIINNHLNNKKLIHN